MKHAHFLAHLVSKLFPASVFASLTPIFMLHRLTGSSPSHMERHIEHLKWCFKYIRDNNYTPISLEQLVSSHLNATPLPKKSVAFTIDDGFWDHYEIAAPLFHKHGIPLTCFVITDFLDRKLWPWDDQIRYVLSLSRLRSFELELPNKEVVTIDSTSGLGSNTFITQQKLKTCPQESLYSWLEYFYQCAEVEEPSTIPDEYRPMTWENAQNFIDMGHAISPHTCTHRILSQLTDSSARFEIEESWSRLSSKLNGSTKVFAYPTGRPSDFGDREEKILRELNFKGAVSTTAQHAKVGCNVFSLPRFSLPSDKLNFIQYLSFIEELKTKIRKA
jgi:peptidoglycan/xylan/chitin deacetylase (PgdA/CDA1 family)